MAKRELDEADDNLTRRDADRRERDAGGDGIYIETETSEGYHGPNLSGDAGRGRDLGGMSEDSDTGRADRAPQALRAVSRED